MKSFPEFSPLSVTTETPHLGCRKLSFLGLPIGAPQPFPAFRPQFSKPPQATPSPGFWHRLVYDTLTKERSEPWQITMLSILPHRRRVVDFGASCMLHSKRSGCEMPRWNRDAGTWGCDALQACFLDLESSLPATALIAAVARGLRK